MLSLAPMKKGMSLTTVKAIVFSLGRDTHKDHHVKNINSDFSNTLSRVPKAEFIL